MDIKSISVEVGAAKGESSSIKFHEKGIPVKGYSMRDLYEALKKKFESDEAPKEIVKEKDQEPQTEAQPEPFNEGIGTGPGGIDQQDMSSPEAGEQGPGDENIGSGDAQE
ncbi:MAG: hypothetical protein ACEPOW_13815 [Bacteroidales bacterium]